MGILKNAYDFIYQGHSMKKEKSFDKASKDFMMKKLSFGRLNICFIVAQMPFDYESSETRNAILLMSWR